MWLRLSRRGRLAIVCRLMQYTDGLSATLRYRRRAKMDRVIQDAMRLADPERWAGFLASDGAEGVPYAGVCLSCLSFWRSVGRSVLMCVRRIYGLGLFGGLSLETKGCLAH
jgi:hypothetical protein